MGQVEVVPGWRRLAAVIRLAMLVLLLVADPVAPALAQPGAPTTDVSGQFADGAYVVKTGQAFNVQAFGICVTVSNRDVQDIYIPLRQSVEFQSFLAHPPSNVTVANCSCGTVASGQDFTQSATTSLACPVGDSGMATQSTTETFLCSDGTPSLVSSVTGPVNNSTCVPSTCTDAGGMMHANGSQWVVESNGTETCVQAGFGAGATGNAITLIATTFQCQAGMISQVGTPSVSVIGTGQCLNSGGGACVPFDLQNPTDTCADHNILQRDPLFEWTAAHNGAVMGEFGQQVCWFAFEFAAHLNWTLSADLCTCSSAVVTDGQVTPIGTFAPLSNGGVDCAPGPNSAAPTSPFNLAPPACPNAAATCVVMPVGTED